VSGLDLPTALALSGLTTLNMKRALRSPLSGIKGLGGGTGGSFVELEAGQGVIIVVQLRPLGDDLEAVAGNEENIIIQEPA
jgi:hypothetical protein